MNLWDSPVKTLRIRCVAVARTWLPLSGLGVVDGYMVQPGDPVLVTAQADTATNGVYFAQVGPWLRSLVAVHALEAITSEGVCYSDTLWYTPDGRAWSQVWMP